ncbi:MAG: bifunctional proline dehydrogenase/L-glutamate gamma-semialdehyde dehydrogenase PutA [Hyphomicrobiaceae bacterium]|nr:bifunctional proline dehydrogenase/L-glutamate gamma-semialdehyde dehydrogenase PutA [Hyphomicrobiaceae bacterium]
MALFKTTQEAAHAAEAALRPSGSLPDRDEIHAYHLMDEPRLVGALIERAVWTEDEARRTEVLARRLVERARAAKSRAGGVDAFMNEYGLSSEEGVILMCLAEALLRIPDAETADRLIADKIGDGKWAQHLGHSGSFFVNASTFGLMLTGRVVRLGGAQGRSPVDSVKRLVARTGEGIIRQALRRAVKLLGDQFVIGPDIETALKRARPLEAKGYRFSYDMLGEAAHSDGDAKRYFERYLSAIEAIGKASGPLKSQNADATHDRPNISVKLSALHPRFEPGKEQRLQHELMPRLLTLLRAARERGIGVMIDAEEQERLDLELEIFGQALSNPALAGWNGLGIAVQAYSRRALPVLRWLRRVAEAKGKRIPVRLVKGAYWDSEIKWAQERGLADYPVLTRKSHTDLSYLAAVRYILSDPAAFYPAFATHNAQSLAAVHIAAGNAAFEFQRLYGMGDALYEDVIGGAGIGRASRIYAPVGDHADLLAYLVRRLLENGANSSFVHQLADETVPVATIVADPVARLAGEWSSGGRNRIETALPLAKPRDILLPQRMVSEGLALSEPAERGRLLDEIRACLDKPFAAGPIVDGKTVQEDGEPLLAICPHDRRERLGSVYFASRASVQRAIESGTEAAHGWDMTPAETRARILEVAAQMLLRDRARLMAVIIRETGKTLANAQAEVREAIDFLNYYASQARTTFDGPRVLKGPTGEVNSIALRARGPMAAISPWNFPLAIFVGQVAAALAAGNPVLAKPAEQSPLVAALAVQLLHEAGVPPNCLHLLPGGGETGAALVRDQRVKGVLFTGSNETAWAIQKALAERRGAIIPFIAETGGVNAMIADSTALPEQVVRDAVRSAFDSAGQRCSAARVLFIQADVAKRVIDLLAGATEALDVGDPLDFAMDIGPVIDEASQDRLESHKLRMSRAHQRIVDLALPEACRVGTFVSPAVYEVGRMEDIGGEVFGPILHVIRYQRGHLDRVINAINGQEYGLTLSVHSRIEDVADQVAERARVGNIYVNRNQIGAVPGVQPFGGEGLSGTGPKAGGPRMLQALVTERVMSVDVTAAGGNAELLSLSGEKGAKARD